jgi:hypothetical protein
VIRPYDRDALRRDYRQAQPFPFFVIENFLEPEAAASIVAAYPDYSEARRIGDEFSAVNEKLKVQVTDSKLFPPVVKTMADELLGQKFLDDLEYITGIPRLVSDPCFGGGGMHLTSSSGRLDVHVDYNYRTEDDLFRRLNILLYLNPVWEEAWGGKIELWNADVTRCVQSWSPVLNRCLVFETSEISFHGVTPIRCPPGVVRKSFAAYYYTREAPPGWDGQIHSTQFRARPDEKFRGNVLMPAERLGRRLRTMWADTKRAIRNQLSG